jgi:hypothetical protein
MINWSKNPTPTFSQFLKGLPKVSCVDSDGSITQTTKRQPITKKPVYKDMNHNPKIF